MKPKGVPWRTLLPRDTETGQYQRHVDCVEECDRDEINTSCREMPGVAFLTGRYKALIEEDIRFKEEKKKRKKEKYKKVKKNVGKALRSTWKCFMLGLHNFALGYSTPIAVAATFMPDFNPGRSTT
uniref:required for drug-induced death protein 1-like n=1 Tax=Doryrhamphus excisus TaxID=161450 RepID=UPI0025AE1682|nr:required for drug-induced death protein 1-like [Doryrhamphus excisus]